MVPDYTRLYYNVLIQFGAPYRDDGDLVAAVEYEEGVLFDVVIGNDPPVVSLFSDLHNLHEVKWKLYQQVRFSGNSDVYFIPSVYRDSDYKRYVYWSSVVSLFPYVTHVKICGCHPSNTSLHDNGLFMFTDDCCHWYRSGHGETEYRKRSKNTYFVNEDMKDGASLQWPIEDSYRTWILFTHEEVEGVSKCKCALYHKEDV
jgi:hypothetical protein